ncbi:ATP-binding protein [Nocardioides szechwanensis]|uniref:ATP-binding protein n=1 Tax=Nocardioides szechwanensis TaxID=1005944 RepID=UPI003531024E
MHALFEPFTQTDPSATRGYEGAELGLAICRDLVDLMGGQLQTSPTIRGGTTFTFVVPLGHSSEGNVGEQDR